ncbi:MAG: hypothetical protein M1277_01095 [Patescibacteria group bacterium]|nr:hypothetical protein [Patescibacteria group bacterium]
MIELTRNRDNPILKPNPINAWEAKAVYNGSIIKDMGLFRMVYRALSEETLYNGYRMQLSTIGCTTSSDGIHFIKREQLITPSETWDKFGCEDPRITKIDGEYFIFYTALSDYPFRPGGIKVGLAIFSDFTKPSEKHLITPFNAKAMVLLPEKINGKYVALLTVNTDIPPSYIAIAWFDKKEDIWSQVYWNNWYQHLSEHILPLSRINSDQIEVGSVPILTAEGWLFVYSHIKHYNDESHRTFGVEAVLLDRENPQRVIARTEKPILLPKADYEEHGLIPNIVFPSGGVVQDNTLSVYYGAADTTCCLATCSISELIKEMRFYSPVALKTERPLLSPILEPIPYHSWEAKAVFNPGVIQIKNTIYLVYRAMGFENTSVLGHAISKNGLTIDKRAEMPIYVPRAAFENKKKPGGNSGCEDPRITMLNDKLYMCYTAYDGLNVPRVAFTSIVTDSFLKGDFNWADPVLISPPGIDDKDAAIFPEKINGKFVVIHRIQDSIVFDKVDTLDFDGKTWLRSLFYITAREDFWDSEKIGICAPPIKTDKGWFILYHGVSKWSHEYRVGAMLLDLENPEIVLARTPWPILEPQTKFEKEGYVNNVVFPCGTALINDTLFIYYGGADKVTGVVTISFSNLLNYLLDYPTGRKVN